MDKDPAMRLMVRRTKIGRGKRVAIMVAVLLGVAVVIGVVVTGFRGSNILQNSEAMTTPIETPSKHTLRPWWLQ